MKTRELVSAGDVTVSYTVQEKSGTSFIQATDSDGFPIYNLSVSTSENSVTTGSRTKISKPGEYRIITTALAGTLCGVSGGGTSDLKFNFGMTKFIPHVQQRQRNKA